MTTATNENIKKDIIDGETVIPVMEVLNPIVDNGAEILPAAMPIFENPNYPNELDNSVDDKVSEYADIDIACDMVNNAVKKRNEDINTARKNEAIEKQRKRDKVIEDKRIATHNANIERVKAARRARKKMAKNMTFIMAIISALCSTIVIGILIWISLDISEWLFAGIIGAIGMLNTLIHTYTYRYIREEIFRK